tara:strand:+ start:113 stop:532 length:420 start_codon:yes stop_codon:yes gene_type:complete
MAYLSKEELKKMRDNIKKVFPAKEGWKLSIRNRNHSTVCVDLLKGNFKDEGHRTVNHYRTTDDDSGRFTSSINEILELSVENYDNSDSMTDYFDVGYYKDISIGRWDKEYVYNEGKSVNWDEIKKRVSALKIIETLKKD